MKVITNVKLIKKNRKIGQISTLIALGILIIGLVITYVRKEEMIWSFVALGLGIVISQVGSYYGSRWGRTPSAEELLGLALKGLDDKYVLYNYTSPVSHLLVGPAGIIALIPQFQGGYISYNVDKKRFTRKGGSLYLKFFGQERFGKPENEVSAAKKDLIAFIDQQFDKDAPSIESLLVFTDPKVSLDIARSPVQGVTAEKLKDFLRKKSKNKPVGLEILERIKSALPAESIV